jgi:pyruvate formate lyase activating enzyme
MQSQTHKSEIGNRQSKMSSVYAYLEKPSMVDYPKHFAAVFFTSGCNFSCGFCHNAGLMGKKQAGLSMNKLEDACTKFKKDWVNGIVITGGEPTLAPDLIELIHFFKSFGFNIKLDTNGSNPDLLAACLPLVDYVAMDIKTGFSGYPDLVQYHKTDRLQRSINLLKTGDVDYEFRTTVIDSFHTDDVMDEVAGIVHGSKRLALQAFIPRDDLPDARFPHHPRNPPTRHLPTKSSCAGLKKRT